MRYALYAVPAEGSALLAAGRRWLGRDEATGLALDQPAVPGLDGEAMAAATAEPRRYGFHATLKAPFGLAAGQGEAALLDAAAAFAARRRPAQLEEPRVGRVGGMGAGAFLALVGRPGGSVQALADVVVAEFEPFRAPLAEADRARRLATGLSARQAALLERWGYPYVFEEFGFHMTLTGRLDGGALVAAEAAARVAFAPWLAGPLAVDTLAVFVEPEPGAPFRRLASFALRG